jgi:hypothetical protein
MLTGRVLYAPLLFHVVGANLIWCNHPSTQLATVVKHFGSLKSVLVLLIAHNGELCYKGHLTMFKM